MNGKPSAVGLIALLFSLVAIGLSLYAIFDRTPQEINEVENRVYQRILAECSEELMPVYADFGVKTTESPKSFKELIHPLVSLNKPATP